MTSPHPAPRTTDGLPLPSSLRLAFSQAADIPRLAGMFNPAIKGRIDPQNFVVKREQAIFDATVGRGGSAFLYDPATGDVHALTMSYDVEDRNSGAHIYSEIGTSLARIAGYNSAQVVVAALALKEWWQRKPRDLIVTEIMPNNGPSLHLYRDTLGWSPVTDAARVADLADRCNELIAPEDKNRPTIWFCCDQQVLPKLASVLIEHLDRGSVANKRTGDAIPVDLAALDAAGLTRNVLNRIAAGIVDRTMLNAPATPTAPRP